MPLRTAVFSRPTALTLGAATSDRVTCGAAADISGAVRFTLGMIVKTTTLTDSRQLASKVDATGARGFNFEIAGTTGNMALSYNGATDLFYQTSSNPLRLNSWQCIAVTVNTTLGAGAKVRLYASPSTAEDLIEATQSAPTEGVTLAADNTSDNFLWGNDASLVVAFQGSLTMGFYVPHVVWSLDQLQGWRRQPLKVMPSMRVLTVFDKETGLLIDRTGLGHDGTVT